MGKKSQGQARAQLARGSIVKRTTMEWDQQTLSKLEALTGHGQLARLGRNEVVRRAVRSATVASILKEGTGHE